MGKMNEQMFINLSNHSSDNWDELQLREAERYGKIEDIPFPQISGLMSRGEIIQLAEEMVQMIVKKSPSAVMCQGEFTLTYNIVKGLKENGIKVLAACSERMVEENKNTKIVRFKFNQFREY